MKPNSHAEYRNCAAWEERLHACETTLAANISNPAAWRWRVQIRVLKFLLARYGSENPPLLQPRQSPRRPLFFNFVWLAKYSAPKSASAIRQVLDKIVEANRDKSVEVPRFVIRPSQEEPQLYDSEFTLWLLSNKKLQKAAPTFYNWLYGFAVLYRHFPALATAIVVAMWLIFYLGLFFLANIHFSP